LPRHNPELVDFFRLRLQDQSSAWQAPLEDRVLQILRSDLAGGPPNLTRIADRLGLSSRTLQRRLASGGASFADLLLRARREIVAAHRRRATPTPLSRLAFELGLSDATAASRFIRLKIGGAENGVPTPGSRAATQA
jgi:AraC-like DNA-binding protein